MTEVFLRYFVVARGGSGMTLAKVAVKTGVRGVESGLKRWGEVKGGWYCAGLGV